MDFTIPDLVGLVGVALIIAAYMLLQYETYRFDDTPYLALNLTGALLIIFSLYFKFNVSAFAIEACWVAISLYGFWKKWRRADG